MKCEGCKKQLKASNCQTCFMEAGKLQDKLMNSTQKLQKKYKAVKEEKNLAVKEIYRIGLIVADTPRDSLSFRLRNFYGI